MRRLGGDIRTRAAQPQLLESVELTPGGRKKHTLQRTSPGGTTRASQYTSPSRAEVAAEICLHEGCVPEDLDMDLDWELDMEQWRRRCLALEYVPVQKTEAQRRAKLAKRRFECAIYWKERRPRPCLAVGVHCSIATVPP